MRNRFLVVVFSLVAGVPVHLAFGVPQSESKAEGASGTSLIVAVASLIYFGHRISRHRIFYTKHKLLLRVMANIIMMNITLTYIMPRFKLTAYLCKVVAEAFCEYIIDLDSVRALGGLLESEEAAKLMTTVCAVAFLDYALRTSLLLEDTAYFCRKLIGTTNCFTCTQSCCRYFKHLKKQFAADGKCENMRTRSGVRVATAERELELARKSSNLPHIYL